VPVIRDGRGKERVEPTVPPAAVPSGPIERSQVSAQRMADFAAERAAAARPQPPRDNRPPGSERHRESSRRGGTGSFEPTSAEKRASGAKGAAASAASRAIRRPEPAPAVPPASIAGRSREDKAGHRTHGYIAAREARAVRVLEALDRLDDDVDAAAADLGMRRNTVVMVAKHARIRARDVARPPQRPQPRIVKPADIALEGRGAGAPVTAALNGAPASPAATDEATPPGPTPSKTLADRIAAAGRAETIVRDVREELTDQLAATRDGISLNLTIRIGAAEMATWGPGRISDFFAGLARVVQAHQAAER
jgi:hypothetical protein